MSFNTIFDIAGSGLSAETTRMSTTASNMANTNVVTGDPNEVYKAQYPIFTEVQDKANQAYAGTSPAGVRVKDIYESQSDPVKRYEPNNPIADKDGFVYAPSVSSVEEMANWISASRSYQMNLALLSTTKQLVQSALKLGE